MTPRYEPTWGEYLLELRNAHARTRKLLSKALKEKNWGLVAQWALSLQKLEADIDRAASMQRRSRGR